MEGEFVQNSESTEIENVEHSSVSLMHTSSEMLKTSEVKEFDEIEVNDNPATTNSNGCDGPSNDVVMNGGGMTTSESLASPNDFVAQSNGSGTEVVVVPSDVVEEVETEIKNEEKVDEVDDINAEGKFTSKEEPVTSTEDFVTELNGSVTEVADSDVVKEIETENRNQLNNAIAVDMNVEEELPLKEVSSSSPDDFVTKSTGSVTEVADSVEVKEIETEIKDEDTTNVVDGINAEEEFPCKPESVTSTAEIVAESKEIDTEVATPDVVEGVETESKDHVKVGVADDKYAEEEIPSTEESSSSPADFVVESTGSCTEMTHSDVVEEVETETKNRAKVEVDDKINAEEEFPSRVESASSPVNFVSESNESGTEMKLSEEVERVETDIQSQVKVGVAADIKVEETFPSKVDEKNDVQVRSVDSEVTHTMQEVSAPASHLENHSAVASDGSTETATDDVFENSAQQPIDAVSLDAFNKDGNDLAMNSVEADQSQPTVSGDFSNCPASLDAGFQSQEAEKDGEDSKSKDGADETSASEVLREEEKHVKQKQLEKRTDEENFMSPMSALGTDYAALARSQSTDSNVSEGRWSQEPVNRTQVEKVVAPEITRNVRMMFESGQIQDLHEIKKTVASLEEPTDSGVFENEPVQREGVVRSGEYVNDVDDVQKGATKTLLNQWKDKGKEEFKADKKPINLAEDEGRVLESEPVRRSDVVREEDTDQEKELPSKGQARILTQQWISRKDDFAKEQKPIKLFENETEPSVVENQPEVRMDVLREDDNLEEIWLRKGFTKDLAGYWAGPKEEVRAPRDVIDLGQEADGVIAENEPTRLEGVVRGDDLNEEVLPIEKGRARSMVSKWSTLPEEAAKQPFQLNVNPNEVGVYENEPIQLEGVVRGTSQVDEVLGQKGMIKNIAGKFSQTEEEPRNRKEMIVIDKAEGPSILENNPEPVRADVVRGEYTDEVQVEKGTTKNLVHKWKTQDLDQTSFRQNIDRTDPSWILEAEKAAESGVFENQPQVRSDVFREVDYEPEMISVTETRNMRAKWSKMGQNDGQKPDKAPELVRFTPPRELTPPRANQEEFKSYQALTLSSDSTFTACGPSPATNGNSRTAAQPRSPVYSPGGSSYPAQSPSGDQTLKSSAMFVLKSS